MSRRVNAFSILELIITISIIAILSTMMILKSDAYRSYKEKLELDRILMDLNTVRSTSIYNKERSQFSIEGSNNYTYDNGKSSISVQLDYINIDMANTNIHKIIFTKNGVPDFDSPGTITIDKSDRKYVLTVTPVTGSINLRRQEDETQRKNFD